MNDFFNKQMSWSKIGLLLAIAFQTTTAQRLASPLGFPLQLSGGFGDLRAGHYHAGIDFRTQSTEGHALYAVLDGYISRISVSPGGYGLGIYVTHPVDSLITVYGHLQRFTPRMAQYVKEKQYEKESFSIDLSFRPHEIPVKQGDIIGYSGNSGNSSGPHLHFEVRDLLTNEYIDPLTFYKSRIPDTQIPQVRGLRIYPIEGKGMVNGSNQKQDIKFVLDKNGQPMITEPIEAWGEIGLGIRAVDRMNGTQFSYGVRYILLTVDEREIYLSEIDRFTQDESGYINSQTDYEEWSENRQFYIKTFVEPGNRARFIASRNAGKITVNEERTYHVLMTLTDLYGNTCFVPIRITGKKQKISEPDTIGTTLLRWYDYNMFSARGIRMNIPRGSLYSSVDMHYKAISIDSLYSVAHQLHKSPVALHQPAQLSIYLDSACNDSIVRQLGIVRIYPNGRFSWVGGSFRDGYIDANISVLATYAVARDSIPPKITPVEPSRWREKKHIKIRMTDNLSGISSFRGEINGQYALFEYDGKTNMLTYYFDEERVPPGYHHLKLTVIDRCGNKSVFENKFSW